MPVWKARALSVLSFQGRALAGAFLTPISSILLTVWYVHGFVAAISSGNNNTTERLPTFDSELGRAWGLSQVIGGGDGVGTNILRDHIAHLQVVLSILLKDHVATLILQGLPIEGPCQLRGRLPCHLAGELCRGIHLHLWSSRARDYF